MMTEIWFRITPTARQLGVSVMTINRWLKAGTIHSVRTVGGEHRFSKSEINRLLGVTEPSKKTVIYSRVSSNDQRGDLDAQETLLEQYAIRNGYSEIVKLKDIGSGLNPKRVNFRKLTAMIDLNEVSMVIVTYKDRLTRFGFEYIESYFKSHNCQIVVINQEETQDPQKELVNDLISIITSFSGKIYGQRSHKTMKIIEDVKAVLRS